MTLFAQGALLGLSAAAQPGPYQAYLLAQSLRNGAVRTLPVVLVPLTSDPPVIAAVLVALAQVPAGLLRALQLLGGAVVLWLAFTALRGLRAPPAAPEAKAPPRGFWRAVLLNFTNPNAWIFWSAVGGPVLAAAWRDGPGDAGGFLAGFYAFLLGGNAALVAAAGGLGRLGPRTQRALTAVSGLALLAFGLWQLAKGLSGPRA
ncbi:LysE family translocator [Anaeromyxobacter sp. PSR-1]|uniref:LysE family translocator n=1 Tax=unclassified Anaeromyxobacter TaxID=2620896 RepID=UPI0005E7C1FF|nr:LysE family transporter [Anaeromyxobacter sp. PSR-1]GAO04673.1 lysE type translocator [Anaeromyxobacter sp. PSR-1]